MAASLGVAGITALQALRDYGKLPIGPGPGADKGGTSGVPNVLVANASGGVGLYAVQVRGGLSRAKAERGKCWLAVPAGEA